MKLEPLNSWFVRPASPYQVKVPPLPVALSVAVPAPAPVAAIQSNDALFAIVPITDGVSTLEIESVEMVLREIELELPDAPDEIRDVGAFLERVTREP